MARRIDEDSAWKATLEKITDRSKRIWFDQAMEYGKAHESFTTIKIDTEQYKAWISYFARRGWAPYALQRLIDESRWMQADERSQLAWTAPCEWPNDFPV